MKLILPSRADFEVEGKECKGSLQNQQEAYDRLEVRYSSDKSRKPAHIRRRSLLIIVKTMLADGC